MFGNLSSSTVLCVILGLMIFYYYNKLQDSEKEFLSLHKKFDDAYTENQKMKSRLKDFEYYKNDISKTFKILDKELEQINDHIYKQNPTSQEQAQVQHQVQHQVQQRRLFNPIRTVHRTISTPITATVRREGTAFLPTLPINIEDGRGTTRNNISLLTPDILSSLFNTMNTENMSVQPQPQSQQQPTTQQQPQVQAQLQVQQPQVQAQVQQVQVQQVQLQVKEDDIQLQQVKEDDKTNIENDSGESKLYDINYLSSNVNYDQFLME